VAFGKSWRKRSVLSQPLCGEVAQESFPAFENVVFSERVTNLIYNILGGLESNNSVPEERSISTVRCRKHTGEMKLRLEQRQTEAFLP
jgi:hypothetical protein